MYEIIVKSATRRIGGNDNQWSGASNIGPTLAAIRDVVLRSPRYSQGVEVLEKLALVMGSSLPAAWSEQAIPHDSSRYLKGQFSSGERRLSVVAASAPRMSFALKSVCDFGDSGKADNFQAYAAFTSAQFLFQFALAELA